MPKYTDVRTPTASTPGSRRRASTGTPMQVGPLAQVLVGFAQGHEPTDAVGDEDARDRRQGRRRDADAGGAALDARPPRRAHDPHRGHRRARARSTGSCSPKTSARATRAIFNEPVFPKGEQQGFGFHEAPRGTLSHWIVIEDGTIKNYQAVVPSTWNAGPRDAKDQPGPVRGVARRQPGRRRRAAARGAAHRSTRSIPCIACAIHTLDVDGHESREVEGALMATLRARPRQRADGRRRLRPGGVRAFEAAYVVGPDVERDRSRDARPRSVAVARRRRRGRSSSTPCTRRCRPGIAADLPEGRRCSRHRPGRPRQPSRSRRARRRCWRSSSPAARLASSRSSASCRRTTDDGRSHLCAGGGRGGPAPRVEAMCAALERTGIHGARVAPPAAPCRALVADPPRSRKSSRAGSLPEIRRAVRRNTSEISQRGVARRLRLVGIMTISARRARGSPVSRSAAPCRASASGPGSTASRAQAGVTGRVHNDAAGVTIDAFGDPTALEHFVDAAARRAAAGGADTRVPAGADPARAATPDFVDRSQRRRRRARVCRFRRIWRPAPECAREIADPADRRYRYPFTNCTNCGPRFTIATGIPYDRAATTMAPFAMCPACRREYEDPGDRRFHAQPNACPVCGPRLSLVAFNGQRDRRRRSDRARRPRRCAAGMIVAIKGLGGFHLACDATCPDAVARLRERKHRDEKPFAVMVRDLAAAEALAILGDEERRAADVGRAPDRARRRARGDRARAERRAAQRDDRAVAAVHAAASPAAARMSAARWS